MRRKGLCVVGAVAAAWMALAAPAPVLAQGSGTETAYYQSGDSGQDGFSSASVTYNWRVIACAGEIHVAYGLVRGSLQHDSRYWFGGEPHQVQARVPDVGSASIEVTAYRGPGDPFQRFRDGVAGEALGYGCFSGQSQRVAMVRDFLTNPTPQQVEALLASINVSIRVTGPLISQSAEREILSARMDEERARREAEQAEADRLAELDRMRQLRAGAEETRVAQEEAAREAEARAAREARAGGDEQLLAELERLDAIRARAGGGGSGAAAEDPTGVLRISSPVDGAVSDANVVWVEGTADLAALPPGETPQLSLAVNGQSQLVSVDSAGAFRTAAVLGAGENALLLTLDTPAGRSSVARRVTYSGQGNGLRVTLTWDGYADIDLYVTSPAGNVVYYSNRSADGMSLDVDNTSAYGPENVTVPQAAPGVYSFAANNYSGTSGVTARIDVFVDEALQSSQQYTFAGGGRWEAGSVTIGAPAAGNTYQPRVEGAIIMSVD